MSRTMLTILCATAALTLWAGNARANLVTNPGFETGDFTGWTNAGDGILIDNVFPNGGSYDAAFSAGTTDPSPGILSQALSTTAGASYDLSFALFNAGALPGDTSDTFTATLGSFSVTLTADDVFNQPNSLFGYNTESFLIPAADIVGNDLLSFSGGNDANTWNLDDVSVNQVAVPEPSSLALLGGALIALVMVPVIGWRPKRDRAG